MLQACSISNHVAYCPPPDDKKMDWLHLSAYRGDLIEELAHEAFLNKGGEVWKEIQFVLFHMNLRLMDEGFAVGTKRAEKEWALRNAIEQLGSNSRFLIRYRSFSPI